MDCLHPRRVFHRFEKVVDGSVRSTNWPYDVPCGKCAYCLATRRSDWATRLHFEAEQHVVKRFVTLTYHPKYLVTRNGLGQLVKSHLQLWFKRIRREGYSVRYYAVGEYGTTTYRPHYHVLLFGDVPEDVLRDKWFRGHVHIGVLNRASVMYALGYVINSKQVDLKGRSLPFATMSLKPGIGHWYCVDPDIVAWHRSDRRNYVIIDGEKRHLPRYYKNRMFSKIDHVRMAVRDTKVAYQKLLEWVRAHPEQRDPLAYYEDMQLQNALLILSRTKNQVQL